VEQKKEVRILGFDIMKSYSDVNLEDGFVKSKKDVLEGGMNYGKMIFIGK